MFNLISDMGFHSGAVVTVHCGPQNCELDRIQTAKNLFSLKF